MRQRLEEGQRYEGHSHGRGETERHKASWVFLEPKVSGKGLPADRGRSSKDSIAHAEQLDH